MFEVKANLRTCDRLVFHCMMASPSDNQTPQKIYDFPGKAKSDVWHSFGFYKKDNGHELDKSKVICKICRKEYSYVGKQSIQVSQAPKNITP